MRLDGGAARGAARVPVRVCHHQRVQVCGRQPPHLKDTRQSRHT